MSHIPVAKCYLCGQDDKLYLVEFTEWVCEKDKIKLDKYFHKLKGRRHTRYHSVESFKKAHRLEEYEVHK